MLVDNQNETATKSVNRFGQGALERRKGELSACSNMSALFKTLLLGQSYFLRMVILQLYL